MGNQGLRSTYTKIIYYYGPIDNVQSCRSQLLKCLCVDYFGCPT